VYGWMIRTGQIFFSIYVSMNYLQDLKGGNFCPSHVINETRAVGSRVDGSNHPQTTNIVHAGPIIYLCGTHVDS
jgi:hypothetical protein